LEACGPAFYAAMFGALFAAILDYTDAEKEEKGNLLKKNLLQ
jgi:hypothetical protein